MPTGTVKVFGSNGHGFITPDEGGAPVTVQLQHMAPGSPAPREGQRVQFETRSGVIGSQALNVRAVDAAVRENSKRGLASKRHIDSLD